MTTTAPVSHGRGGTGNIGPDDAQYVDGGIHREGDPTASGGAYSTGRGGASNIASPGHAPVKSTDDDIVPEVAKVVTHDEPHHAGRGGEGNVVIPDNKAKKAHKGLADRIKHKLQQILGRKPKPVATAKAEDSKAEKKKEETKPTTEEAPKPAEPPAEAAKPAEEVKA